MIAKISAGSGFRGTLDYVLRQAAQAEIIGGNMAGRDARELAAEFATSRALREDIARPVYHVSVTLPASESLDNDNWQKIVNKYLSRMGLDPDARQFVVVRHRDTDHDHIHIVTSRVDLSGAVWDPYRDRYRSRDICRQLEAEHNLQRVSNNKRQYQAATTQSERRMIARTGVPTGKIVVAETINNIVSGDRISHQAFVEGLADAGIQAIPNIASTGRINGYSFATADGMRYTGAQVGYKWAHLQALLITPDVETVAYLQEVRHGGPTAGDTGYSQQAVGYNGSAGRADEHGRQDDAGLGGGADQPAISAVSGDSTATGDIQDIPLAQVDVSSNGAGGDAGGDGSVTAGVITTGDKQANDTVTAEVASWGTLADELGILQGGNNMTKNRLIDYREQVWDRQAQALGAPLYRVTGVGRGRHAGRGINFCRPRGGGDEVLWTAEQVRAHIPALSQKNIQGYDIYITPMDPDYHYMLLDDLTAAGVEHVRATCDPCLIQASSKDNYQAIVKVTRSRDWAHEDEQSVGNTLLKQLNTLPAGMGGDRGISAPIHPFRMVGYSNKKEGRGDAQTKICYLAPGKICARTSDRLDQLREARMAEADSREQVRRQDAIASAYMPGIRPRDDSRSTPTDDVYRRRWARQAGLSEHQYKTGKWGAPDYSAIDWRVACSMLQDGYSAQDVADSMMHCSPWLGTVRHKRNASDYVAITVANAVKVTANASKDRGVIGGADMGR